MTRFLVFLLALTIPLRAATSVAIISNSPPSGNLNYVICGDAFDAANQSGFLVVATNIARALTNGTAGFNNWIGTNNNRINVYAVLTNSSVNGSTATSAQTNTPFGGYLLGTAGRINQTLLSAALTDTGFYSPDYKWIVVLNRGEYAGATFFLSMVITTNSDVQIAVHESGHLVANLGDEYSGGFSPGYTNTAESLVAATNQWLSEFPTLGAPVAVDIGYVPTSACKMRSVGSEFCVVCSNRFAVLLGFTNAPGGSGPGAWTNGPRSRISTIRIR